MYRMGADDRRGRRVLVGGGDRGPLYVADSLGAHGCPLFPAETVTISC